MHVGPAPAIRLSLPSKSRPKLMSGRCIRFRFGGMRAARKPLHPKRDLYNIFTTVARVRAANVYLKQKQSLRFVCVFLQTEKS